MDSGLVNDFPCFASVLQFLSDNKAGSNYTTGTISVG